MEFCREIKYYYILYIIFKTVSVTEIQWSSEIFQKTYFRVKVIFIHPCLLIFQFNLIMSVSMEKSIKQKTRIKLSCFSRKIWPSPLPHKVVNKADREENIDK